MRHIIPLLLMAALARGDLLLITEVVTDPQADHSENSGGDGVPYNLVPGSGTISSVDEFIEIHNAGGEIVDLTGYSLHFLDTTASVYVFGNAGSEVLRFSAGSALDALLPGGYLLVGNPPGALNNRIDIVLRDKDNLELDLLEIADGNATGSADEAIARVFFGDHFGSTFHPAAITPLEPSPITTPEPGTFLLVGLLFSAAAIATGRTERWRARRRPAGSRASLPSPCRAPAASHGSPRCPADPAERP